MLTLMLSTFIPLVLRRLLLDVVVLGLAMVAGDPVINDARAYDVASYDR